MTQQHEEECALQNKSSLDIFDVPRVEVWWVYEKTHLSFLRPDCRGILAWWNEPCLGLADYVMIWTKEPFIKNEKSIIDVLISWVNKT